jgi:hypothetical protein
VVFPVPDNTRNEERIMRRGIRPLNIPESAGMLLTASMLCLALGFGFTGCNRSTTAREDAAAASALTAEGPEASNPGAPGEMALTSRNAGRPAPAPRIYTIDAGTPIRVRTTSTISTKSYQSGQTFVATLAEPLVVEDRVIAKRGAEVVGRVVNSDPGGRVKGVASITLTLAKLETVDGGEIAIDTNNIGRQARTTKKKDATKIGIGAGIGAAIGALAGGGKGAAIGAASGGGAGTGVVLATRGEPAVVPAESLLTFRTQAPVEIRN